MTLRVVARVPVEKLLSDPASIEEDFRLVLPCAACGHPIETEAWLVFHAGEAWSEGGAHPLAAHRDCRERLIRARFEREHLASVRLASIGSNLGGPLTIAGPDGA